MNISYTVKQSRAFSLNEAVYNDELISRHFNILLLNERVPAASTLHLVSNVSGGNFSFISGHQLLFLLPCH